MSQENVCAFNVKFPGSIEYIPAVRRYVSETLLANNFDPKFTYRSEIIVDEICNNAVSFGCVSVDAVVELVCSIRADKIEFVVRDEGGREDDLKKLTSAIKKKPKRVFPQGLGKKDGLGLEIVRMLSDELTFEVDPDNLTTVRVVKLREEDGGEDGQDEGGIDAA